MSSPIKRSTENPLPTYPPPDLAARVVYFPIRHHSPACAWHVARLIRELRPEAVLIEGPRDATPLVPLLLDPETTLPVAIYATYVRRTEAGLPDRAASYYPLCDYSPELAAIRAAAEVGAAVKLIDLTFPEMVEAERPLEAPVPENAPQGSGPQGSDPPAEPDEPPARSPLRRTQSLQDEHWISHSRLLRAACVRTGARDPDDLWDLLFEDDYRARTTSDFIRNVYAYCELARRDSTPERLEADGTLARERAMASAVAEEKGRTLVVTGGFHTVALPTTKPAMPKPLKIPADDHQVVLMRYGFEQLDRLNGYSAGMPAPEFYQRSWEDRDPARWLVEIARECRRRNLGTSTADAIAALDQTHLLAQLRGHHRPTREDILDGVRSTFIKGADDAEGVPVLAIARKLMAGHRVGNVPAAAGQPPIVHDFRYTATRLKLKLDKLDEIEATLDLYRKRPHREISRLFHRLAFLSVPFATFKRGPDFVAGVDLERIREIWSYHWSPRTESALIERSLYGSTVEEAASSLLLERFAEAEAQGQGRSAAVATGLVLHACRMGLHRHTQELLARVGALLGGDASFSSLVGALENLLALEFSREPLEAQHLIGLRELATAAFQRACFVLPTLVATPSEEEASQLDALKSLSQAVHTLGDSPDLHQLRTDALRGLADSTGGSSALRGGAVGLLYGDGNLADDELVRRLRGHLLSARDDGTDGPNFLRGLLNTAREVLWQVPECLAGIDEVLRDWDDAQFVRLLPVLRLALADLTPRETDSVAKLVTTMLGAESLKLQGLGAVAAGDMLQAVEVNRLLVERLTADGLEVLCE